MVYFFIEERFDVLEFCSIKYKQKKRERLCQYLDAFLLEMFLFCGIWPSPKTPGWTLCGTKLWDFLGSALWIVWSRSCDVCCACHMPDPPVLSVEFLQRDSLLSKQHYLLSLVSFRSLYLKQKKVNTL